MRPRFLCYVLVTVLTTGANLRAVQADGVVVLNATSQVVEFVANSSGVPPRQIRLASEDMVTIPMRAMLSVSCLAARPDAYELDANSTHVFKQAENGDLTLLPFDRPQDERTGGGREIGNPADLTKIGAIPVKILVDNNERAVQRLWEARLRKRVQAASDILSKLFLVRFEVVACDTWTSNDQITDFGEALRQFEIQVKRESARLVIGFTSQRELHGKRNHLGGCRGPLSSHILIRESGVGIREAERLKVLVHELGHFLGAAHSCDSAVPKESLGGICVFAAVRCQ